MAALMLLVPRWIAANNAIYRDVYKMQTQGKEVADAASRKKLIGALLARSTLFVARLPLSIAFCPYCGCFLGNGSIWRLYSSLVDVAVQPMLKLRSYDLGPLLHFLTSVGSSCLIAWYSYVSSPSGEWFDFRKILHAFSPALCSYARASCSLLNTTNTRWHHAHLHQRHRCPPSGWAVEYYSILLQTATWLVTVTMLTVSPLSLSWS